MRSTFAHFSLLAAAVKLAALALSSCGAGTAGIVAGTGGSSGGTTVRPAVAAFTIERPKEPEEAKLRFTLSKDATVQFFYKLPGGAARAMEHAGANPRALTAGASAIRWDFASELGLGPVLGIRFHPGVQVFAIIPGVQEQTEEGANALTLGLGNDAPVVHAVTPMPTNPQEPDESAGNVEIRLQISDTSIDPVDLVDLIVEWRRASAAPDAWVRATTTGVFPDGVETPPAPGVQLSFFWNTNVDLEDEEDTVFFRVTATDRTAVGTPFETQVAIRIDNNEEPIAVLDGASFVGNPDSRRGIPLPLSVIDKERDRVRVVLQWRRADESFPDIDLGQIDPILSNEAERRRLQIATEWPVAFDGQATILGPTSLRLPELAQLAAGIIDEHFDELELELLRPSLIPVEPEPWMGELMEPRDLVTLPGGTSALVLERPSSAAWQLRRIDLATGATLSVVASGTQGAGDALALEGTGALVATDLQGDWSVLRVNLETGEVTELFARSNGLVAGEVRALEVLGADGCLLTVGSALLRLDALSSPRVGALVVLEGLSIPWGVAPDPVRRERAFLAESGANRVLEVDLMRRTFAPLAGLGPIEDPRDVVLEPEGPRLLVSTEDSATGGRSLRALTLGGLESGRVDEIADSLPPQADALAVGPDLLRLVLARGENRLFVGGGVQQRLGIAAYDPTRTVVTVETPLVSALPRVVSIPWRFRRTLRAITGSTSGTPGVFNWDARDLNGGGQVVFRALPIDSELGTQADSGAPKEVERDFDSAGRRLLEFDSGPNDVVFGDLTGDGRVDFAASLGGQFGSSGSQLAVARQEGDGSFIELQRLDVGGGPSVDLADIDLDGDLDLIGISQVFQDSSLLVLRWDGTAFQTSGEHVSHPQLAIPLAVLAADVNCDGLLDLVSSNTGPDTASVFLQDLTTGFAAPEVVNVPLPGMPDPIGSALEVADLDGNGLLDLVVGEERLTIARQQAGPAGSIVFLGNLRLGPRSSSPRAAVAADLNRDGLLDVTAASGSSGNVRIYFQDPLASGSFGLQGDLEDPNVQFAAINPTDLDAADLDGDGDLDLAYSDFQENFVRLQYQKHMGAFVRGPSLGDINTARFTDCVALVDLDADGRPDVVTTKTGGNPPFAVNAFDGISSRRPEGFRAEVLEQVTLNTSVAAGDLDADGDLDVLAISQGSNVLLMEQAGPGTFVNRGTIVESNAPSVSVGDIDGDGRLDLAFSGSSFPRVGGPVFLQKASGGFGLSGAGETPDLVLGSSFTFPVFGSFLGDYNGDGRTDVAVPGRVDFATKVALFFQQPDGAFGMNGDPGEPNLSVGSFPSGVNYLVSEDVDGNGLTDLVADARIFLQSSPATFGMNGDPGLPSSVIPGGGFGSSFGDLDSDGLLDVVIGRTNSVAVLYQQSSFFFAEATALGDSTTMVSADHAALGDLDGDGDMDLVVSIGNSVGSTNDNENRVAVFHQTFLGRFPGRNGDPIRPDIVLGSFDITEGAAFSLVLDLDCDGDNDILTKTFNTMPAFYGGN